jgi:polysaccharide chain length determinant protein (PEP-CTERM system associated)
MSAILSMAEPVRPSTMETLHVLLAAAWRRRFVIAVPILVLPVLGAIAGHFAPRTYEARMSVLVQEPGSLNPFFEDLSVKTDLKNRMEALRALLTSRLVLGGVAEDIGLVSPQSPQEQRDRAVAELGHAVSVQLIGNEMVELRLRGRTPHGLADILNRIGERFIDRVEAPEDSSIRDSVMFLRNELQSATDKLNRAEDALANLKSENSQQLPDLRATNVQRLAQLRDSLSDHEIRLAGAETEFAAMRDRMARTDPVIGELEKRIVQTTSELALLRARYTDQHSKVQAALRDLERLQEERTTMLRADATEAPVDMNRLWNLAAATPNRGEESQPLLVSQVELLEKARENLQTLRSETEHLRDAVRDLTQRIEATGQVERELHEREREVQVTGDLVSQLRKRFDMAKVTGALSRYEEPQRVAVIDRPVEPTSPTRPVTLLFAIAGLIGGIALGGGLATILELADTSVRRIRDMERLLGVPVLARVIPMR